MAINTSQIVVELQISASGQVHASQSVIETWLSTLSSVHASQIVLEFLIANVQVVMATYPVLPGLGFSVFKSPLFSTGKGTSASGREARIGYWQVNKWEWVLTYEYLPDKQANGLTPSDLKTLMGFFLITNGGLTGFQFKDPDDHNVTGQSLGYTDGVTTQFTIGRNFNANSASPFEPVGMMDLSGALNVYLGGVLQSPSTYDILTTTPVAQTLRFHAAPAAGSLITMDFSWFFWVTFKDDRMDFEKFMDQLWNLKTVTLVSQRN